MTWRDPRTRVRLATWHLWGSIAAGAACTILVSQDAFERIIMAATFYQITIAALEVLATADVRQQQED